MEKEIQMQVFNLEYKTRNVDTGAVLCGANWSSVQLLRSQNAFQETNFLSF